MTDHRRADDDLSDGHEPQRMMSDEFRTHLESLGIDPESHDEVEEYRAMLRLLRKYYRGGKKMGGWALKGLALAAGGWGFVESMRRLGFIE